MYFSFNRLKNGSSTHAYKIPPTMNSKRYVSLVFTTEQVYEWNRNKNSELDPYSNFYQQQFRGWFFVVFRLVFIFFVKKKHFSSNQIFCFQNFEYFYFCIINSIYIRKLLPFKFKKN